jgi:hypothetical protein
MQPPNDWKNVEMTGIVKFNSGDSSDSWTWYDRGGRHYQRSVKAPPIKLICSMGERYEWQKNNDTSLMYFQAPQHLHLQLPV